MKVVIAGGRDFNDFGLVKEVVDAFHKETQITSVLCGEARGADTLGKSWADFNDVLVDSYPADWNLRGKSAGFYRNQRMAEDCDSVIVFWDGLSHGTAHMINSAKKLGKPVKVVYYSKTIDYLKEEY